MTTAVQPTFTKTIASGSTGTFAYNFRVLSEDDLEVKLNGTIVTTGFKITGVGDYTGGTVVFTSNPAADTVVLVSHKPALKRDTNYPALGERPSETLNADFDRIWHALQYLEQLMFTAVKLPYDETIEPLLTADATARALKYLGFDAAGAIALEDIPDLASTQAAQAAAEAAAATIEGFKNRGAWVTATAYAVNNLVRESGTTYICLVAHTAGTFSTDLAAAKWSIFAQKGDAGAGAGDVVVANNLSEFTATAAAARANLGILAAALYAVGTASGQIPLNSNIYGKHSIWIPVGAMKPRKTQGAAVGSVETTTNKVMIATLDFDYATQDEFAQFAIRAPKSWDEGVFQAEFVWSCAAGATAFGCVWGIQSRAFSDTDSLDQAWGTAATVTDTANSTGDLLRKSDFTGDITPAGTAAEGDYLLFQVYRDFDHASDTLDKDARLHGVLLTYTVNAHNDA